MSQEKNFRGGNESATYQNMYDRVEQILGTISQSDIDLDKLVEHVEEGFTLIQTMKKRLEVTKEKIETIRESFTVKKEDETNN